MALHLNQHPPLTGRGYPGLAGNLLGVENRSFVLRSRAVNNTLDHGTWTSKVVFVTNRGRSCPNPFSRCGATTT